MLAEMGARVQEARSRDQAQADTSMRDISQIAFSSRFVEHEALLYEILRVSRIDLGCHSS